MTGAPPGCVAGAGTADGLFTGEAAETAVACRGCAGAGALPGDVGCALSAGCVARIEASGGGASVAGSCTAEDDGSACCVIGGDDCGDAADMVAGLAPGGVTPDEFPDAFPDTCPGAVADMGAGVGACAVCAPGVFLR